MARKKQKFLHRKLKLSHRRHTGKRLPAHRTSLGLLVLAVLFSGIILGYTTSARADTTAPSGSVSVSGIVPETTENTTIIKNVEPAEPAPSGPLSLGIVWVTFIVMASVTLAFWIGEKYEWEKMRFLWKTQKRSKFSHSFK